MPASEAQIRANQQNAARSTGPKSVEGKENSRRNALKHGLTGAGIALPNEDVAEVERRVAAFQDELQPEGELAEALTRRAAVLSVRLDRCVSHEAATLSDRIRQVEADFVAPEDADPATTQQLKAEAKARAMFDPSREANLARKYEAAAERGFYRALKELRELKKQARASQPEDAAEALRETLASFSQLQHQASAFGSDFFDENPRTPARPQRRPETIPSPAFAGPVDVPMTIGRRC
jgi:hypothetical protein